MREIEFRGQLAKSKKWVSGDLLRNYWVQGDTFVPYSIRYLIDSLYSFPMEVLPETIGQYTGLKDKNGTKIFEGDVVKIKKYQLSYYIKWFDDMCFGFADTRSDYVSTFYNCYDIYKNGFPLSEDLEVIGNIHDNPELLKGE